MNWFDQAKEHLASWKTQAASARAQAKETYTPRALLAFGLARKEAHRLNHNYIGTEHLLLGLILLNNGVAFNVLKNLGLNLEAVRLEFEKYRVGGPSENTFGTIPYTPRAKAVVKIAKAEAKKFGHAYVGTEHLLLGLLEEREGLAAQVFEKFKVEIEKTRREILVEITPIFPLDGMADKSGS